MAGDAQFNGTSIENRQSVSLKLGL